MALLNRLMTALFDVLFAPFVAAPGWVSLIVFSGIAAAIGLLVYKYTSNQDAIKRIKDRIKAHILAIKLFKDDLGVIVGSLVGVLLGSANMMRHALLPLLVMIVPFVLFLAQLGLRYQWRPVSVGEQVVVTVQLDDGVDPIELATAIETDAAVVIEKRVRKPATGEVVWRLHAAEAGRHTLRIRAGEEFVEKTLDVGDGFEGVSPVRSRGSFWEGLLYPSEAPLAEGSAIRSITVAYPPRESILYGADFWLVWLMLISFVMAFALKPVLKVEF